MMKEQNEEYYSIRSITVFLRSFYDFLRKRWLFLLATTVIGMALGITYRYIQKSKYEAVTTFVLEEKSGGGAGLSGLASQFGFDLGSLSGSGSFFSGDNILDIIRSKKVMQQVLLSKIEKDSVHSSKTLADLFLEFNHWKEGWKTEPLKVLTYANAQNAPLTELQDSILNRIHEFLLKKAIYVDRVNKKGSIIKVQVTSQNSLFAQLMSDRMVAEAGKLYLDIKTGNAQANIDRMQRRSDSLLSLLNNKSYTVAASQTLDANPGIKTSAVPTEIAMRDKTMIGTLYLEVTKNLEASKMILAQQSPVIQVLDRPYTPLVDQKKRLLLLLIAGAFAGGAAGVIILGMRFIVKNAQ